MKKFIFIIFIILFFAKNSYTARRFFDDRARFFNDFHAYYIGSYLFWHGEDPYDLNGAFMQTKEKFRLDFLVGSGYSYPPLIAFALLPLLQFSPLTAARIFAAITMLLYLIFCFLIFQEHKKSSLIKLLCLAIFLATFSPAMDSASHGQVNLIVLLCFYFYFQMRQKQKLTSFFLVTAILIKVWPVFFLLKEFAQRNFKFLIKCALWGIMYVLLISIFGGLNLWSTYFFKVLPSINNSLDAYYTNQSINGFLSRALLQPDHTFLISQSVYQPIILTITLVLLAILIFITLRYNSQSLPSRSRSLPCHSGESRNLVSYKIFLLWLGVATILAGKNSFSNFTPCVLIGIYLIDNFHSLNRVMKILFVFSVFLTNFFWQFVWGLNQTFILQNNFFSKLQYVSFTSLGFFAIVMQIILLIMLISKHHHQN